jgi:hypothetical protein
MDAAYDHIQEESFMKEDELKPGDDTPTQSPTLNAEFQDAYNAVVNSPWGARLGGFWGTVKKAVRTPARLAGIVRADSTPERTIPRRSAETQHCREHYGHQRLVRHRKSHSRLVCHSGTRGCRCRISCPGPF